AFLVHRMPDEVFMNLLQAKNLVDWGHYSFQYDANVDGSVAFLPCLVIALLYAIGIDPPLGAILLSAACSAGTVFLLSHWASRKATPALGWLVGLTLALNPSLLELSGSGWSAPMIGLLAAACLAAWDGGRHGLAFALLAVITFVRWESSFYTVSVGFLLVTSTWLLGDEDWRNDGLRYAATLLAPLFFYSFWTIYYGYPIPACVEMKAGSGRPTIIGLQFLSNELLPFALCGLLFIPWMSARTILPVAAWLIPSFIHFAGISYAGGDYMPGNRYYVALMISVAAAGIVGLAGWYPTYRDCLATWSDGKPPWAGKLLITLSFAATTILLVMHSGQPKGIVDKLTEAGKDPSQLNFWNDAGVGGMRGSRLTRHLSAGQFFTWLTRGDKEVKLATGEVASCYYGFTGRPVDIQGFANREVARGPRRTNPDPIWAKRLDPGVWEREQAEIVWLEAIVPHPGTIWLTESFHQAVNAGKPRERTRLLITATQHGWWTEPYFESTYVDEQYLPRVTKVNDAILIIWLVRRDKAAEYDRRLQEAGFQQVEPAELTIRLQEKAKQP
ncbi:MAG: hypothetical protein AB7K24_32635, partial [Gemmataceae bacterium]